MSEELIRVRASRDRRVTDDGTIYLVLRGTPGWVHGFELDVVGSAELEIEWEVALANSVDNKSFQFIGAWLDWRVPPHDVDYIAFEEPTTPSCADTSPETAAVPVRQE